MYGRNRSADNGCAADFIVRGPPGCRALVGHIWPIVVCSTAEPSDTAEATLGWQYTVLNTAVLQH